MSSELSSPSNSVTKDDTKMAESTSTNPVNTDDTPMAEPSEPVVTDTTTMAEPSLSSEPVNKDSAAMMAGISWFSSSIVTVFTPTRAEPSSSSSKPVIKDSTMHDFYFRLKPLTKFRHCIGALCNHLFNPSKMGLLEVDKLNLKITVFSIYPKGETVFGFLNLEPDFFNYFECANSVTKMINLEDVLICLGTVHDESMLTISSVNESNVVTFVFEDGAGREVPGTASDINLHDDIPGYRRLPQISYGFEFSVLSIHLRPLAEKKSLQKEPSERSNYILIETYHAKAQLIVEDYVVDSATESGEVWLNWPFWETLRRATYTSDKCEIYLLTKPAESIMLLFKMSDPDDMICSRKGTFVCDQELSCLVFLRSVS